MAVRIGAGFFHPAGRLWYAHVMSTCRGCDFACPFEKPWCVTDVSLEPVARAWKRLPVADGGNHRANRRGGQEPLPALEAWERAICHSSGASEE